MSNPLGYYTSVMPEDGSYLDVLQQEFGSELEGLTTAQQLILVQGVAAALMLHVEEMKPNKIKDISVIVKLTQQHVTVGNLPGLLECIAHQLNTP
ncbi:MAG: hypothetical protein H0X31_01365 [Nostocaceae cyanobacterium]|nr:hypothetical protein [Nostocaceae cyanobacterium]